MARHQATGIGQVGMRLIRGQACSTAPLPLLRASLPFGAMPAVVRRWRWRNLPRVWQGFWRLGLAYIVMRLTGIPIAYGALSLVKICADGTRLDYGVVSVQKVTSAFVAYVCTRLVDGNTSIGAFDFHGFGSGSNAESNADTALQTEFTTEYATNNTRPTGTPSNPSANIYQSVATFSPDANLTINEHGVFTQAATGGGTLLDRSSAASFNPVPMTNGDSVVATYRFTFAAEA